jgi:hypothetical protein
MWMSAAEQVQAPRAVKETPLAVRPIIDTTKERLPGGVLVALVLLVQLAWVSVLVYLVTRFL